MVGLLGRDFIDIDKLEVERWRGKVGCGVGWWLVIGCMCQMAAKSDEEEVVGTQDRGRR